MSGYSGGATKDYSIISPVSGSSELNTSRASINQPRHKYSALPTPPSRGPVGESLTRDSSSRTTPNSGYEQTSPTSMTKIEDPATSSRKSIRVRTGCLTCRQRHLKCDEALTICVSCKKSNRNCKRGIRLKFHDTTVKDPPYLLPPTHDWKVVLQDDSRDIASEYLGGKERYLALEAAPKRRKRSHESCYDQIGTPITPHQQLPIQTPTQSFFESQQAKHSSSSSSYVDAIQQMQGYAAQSQPQQYARQNLRPQDTSYSMPLHDSTEVFYIQVFVEEVGSWMDSMDADKHFSHLIPFQALREPMLKYALLACGVRHLTLVNPSSYPDRHALVYYNSATQLLLRSLQNPDRNSVLCATTASILNVYEVMSEKALQRMNHIAGARALIKECRWDANATGIGGAYFWLNVGLELFSCLHFNWGVAWDPDTWGIDMTMNPEPLGVNVEEWTHKILWILAKVTNLRSTAPRFQEQTLEAEQMRMQRRLQEWLGLKQFCEQWDCCVPATMHAVANIPVYVPGLKSAFSEVWFVKRTTTVARLFYHTAMALLGAIYPRGASANKQQI